MLALNFRTEDGATEVDLLVGESEAFEELRRRAVEVTVEPRTFLVASLDDLIAMKRRAGRPQTCWTSPSCSAFGTDRPPVDMWMHVPYVQASCEPHSDCRTPSCSKRNARRLGAA